MAITRDRLGRFAGKGGSKSSQESKRAGKTRPNFKGVKGNRTVNKSTLSERMKERLQIKQSKQVSRIVMTGAKGSLKLADRIQAAQRATRNS